MANTCTGKVPIPITGSTIDATEYIALNHPFNLISDYVFTLPLSMLSQISGSYAVPCPQYDDAGITIIGYLAYMPHYRFSHEATGSLSPGIFNIIGQSTYNDFVNAVNTNIGAATTGGNIITTNTPWLIGCQDIWNAISNYALLPANDTYGCIYDGRLCECPNTIINPCVDEVLAAGFPPADVNQVAWNGTWGYVTGNIVEIPLLSNYYYVLLTPGYTNITPFYFDLTNFPLVTPATHDEWTPCQLDPPPITCECPDQITYPQATSIVTIDTGAYDTSQAYSAGEIFQMDWYNYGLQLLLSHPDPNFVAFIQTQGLVNPIGVFELPAYDVSGQVWVNSPNIPSIMVEFMGPCNDDSGTSCYIFHGNLPTDTSVSFVNANLQDWIMGTVIPALAVVPPAPLGQPYWGVQAGYSYTSWHITPGVSSWVEQGVSPLNRHFACCDELLAGCQDPTAMNYQAYIDYSCKDTNPQDGMPDCCVYSNTECLPRLTKEEFLMNVAQKPETRSDVFIERGKTSVFERTQRLAQTPTIGELELHGYGYYKLNEQRF